LEIFTRTVIELASARDIDLPKAVSLLKNIPTDLAEAPFLGVIWDPDREIMIPRGKSLARELLRYMAGFEVSSTKLLEDYRLSVGAFSDATAKLPAKIL
jgi:hypothetical protein